MNATGVVKRLRGVNECSCRWAVGLALIAAAAGCSAPSAASDGGSDAGVQRFPQPSRQKLLESLALWTGCTTNRTEPVGALVAQYFSALYAVVPADPWWRPHRVRSLERQYQCVLGASTCDDVQRCMRLGRDPSECNGASWACAGDEALACSNGEVTVDDCAAAGEVCGLNSIRSAYSCRYSLYEPCGPDRCDPNQRVLNCSLNQWDVVAECARLDPGATCQVSQNTAYCRGGGASCAAPGASCRGTTLVECMGIAGDARERTLDCAQSPFFGRCGGDVRAPGPCDFTNGQCLVTDADRCEGNALVFCGPGGTSRVDCSQIGFRTCAVFGRAARCVP